MTTPSSHASGGRDCWSTPRAVFPADPVAAVWECLGEVLDPEIPISLVELGLVYGVTVDGPERGPTQPSPVDVMVLLTFTATACPCMEFIREDVTDRLEREPWVAKVTLEEVWDPPWTSARISPSGRERLRSMGVAG